jgi:arylesterase/paraoxonase
MTINPWHRIAATASAVLLVTVLAGAYRVAQSHGVFTTVKPGFAGSCRAVPSATGPGDIVIDAKNKIAFVSATDRPARNKGKPSSKDGLYSYAYTEPGAGLVRLSGAPADFHPYGISLYHGPDGTLTLMAVNRRMDKFNTVDIFSVEVENGAVALTEVGSIGGRILSSPTDLAAVDEDRFYVVNDHASKTGLGRWLDDILVLLRANILYFDGVKFVAVADELNSPSGAALSPDGRYLYVPEAYPRTLLTFERNPFSGQLKQANALPIPSNLDHADVAADGSVWLASQPKAFATAAYRGDPSKPAPSEIFRVAVHDGIPQAAWLVYANMGEEIGASSVGATADGHLLIGSPFDNKILDCRLP